MLSGNVTMIVNGAGDIILNGDNQNNHIEITMELDGDGFVGVVRGRDGTTVTRNGQASSSQFFDVQPTDTEIIPGLINSNNSQSTLGDLRVAMNGGDDRVDIVPWLGAVAIGVGVGGDLRVDLGTGNDTLEFHGSGSTDYKDMFGVTRAIPWTIVAGRTDVFGRGGDDDVELRGVSFAERLSVNEGSAGLRFPGDGGAFIELNSVATGGDVSLVAAANSQDIYVSDAYVSGRLNLSSGSGRDVIRVDRAFVMERVLTNAGSSPGREFMALDDSGFRNDLVIRSTAGDQTVQINGITGTGNVDVRLGAGDDALSTSSGGFSRFGGEFMVYGGGGDDEITLTGAVIWGNDVDVISGGGADVIRVHYATDFQGPNPPRIFGDIKFHGGGGVDEVIDIDDLEYHGELDLISIEVRS